MEKKQIFMILGLVAFAIFVRLAFHLPNATPITALALVSSLYIGRRWAVIVPLVALFLSDLLIGFYDWRVMLAVYGSFASIGVASMLLRKYPTKLVGAGLTLGSSLFFFLTTNFAVWAFSPWYAKSVAGLLYCYTLGLPFYRDMVLGDMIYVPLLMGVFAYGHVAAPYLRATRRELAQAFATRV